MLFISPNPNLCGLVELRKDFLGTDARKFVVGQENRICWTMSKSWKCRSMVQVAGYRKFGGGTV